MAKVKTTFFCRNCGTQFSKWQGQGSACKEWNTITEELISKGDKADWNSQSNGFDKKVKPVKIADISFSKEPRLKTNNQEFDRVLGGGLVQ